MNEIELWRRGLCDRIRLLRLAKRVTQVELARKMKLSQSSIAQWESYEHTPTLENIFKFCLALKIHPGELFDKELRV